MVYKLTGKLELKFQKASGGFKPLFVWPEAPVAK